MSTISLIDSLIQSFDVEIDINQSGNLYVDKKQLHQILIQGYTRNYVTRCPAEITSLITLFCPLYQPHCQILINSEYAYTDQIYIKIQDIAPNLSLSSNKNIICKLDCIAYDWNDQFMEFPVPPQSTEEAQQRVDNADAFEENNYKLFQSFQSYIEIDDATYRKWKGFIEKFDSSSNNNGYIKQVPIWPTDDLRPIIAFDKIDNITLDAIEAEFDGCQLWSMWDLVLNDNQTGHPMILFKWSSENNNNDNKKPSQWLLDIMNIKSLPLTDVNIHFGSNILTTIDLPLNLYIRIGDARSWSELSRRGIDLTGRDMDYVHINLNHDYFNFGGAINMNGNTDFKNSIKELMQLWASSEEEMDSWSNVLENENKVSMGRDGGNIVTQNTYLQTLVIVDKMSAYFRTEISVRGGFRAYRK